jgi:YVTN family beta-propeller protein
LCVVTWLPQCLWATGAVTTAGTLPARFGMALSPDGSRLAATGQGQVVVIDRASRTVLGTVPTGGNPRRVRFDRTGATMVVSNEAGWVDYIR